MFTAITYPDDATIAEIPGIDNHMIPILIVGSIALGSVILHFIITFIMRRIAMSSGWTFDIELVKHCSKPTLFMFPVISILITISLISDAVDPKILSPIRHALEIALIIFVTWAAFGVVKASSIIAQNNVFRSRRSHTQIVVTTRIAYGLIGLLGAACVMLTFPRGWELGASLLASASVTALFIGLAAKPSLENLVASLQIALTQPLILDDYVVIDGYSGIVEAIQSQFIVVRSLEDRRFIIPLTRVVTSSFENWSRSNESIPSEFNLYVDYGVPLEDLRKQFYNLVENHENWDRNKRDTILTISDATQNSLVLTITVTATNAMLARKLKSKIRERLIEYMMTTYPQYLPRSRYETLPPRTGVDSMKKVISKMDEALI
ncbi:mechanosensitive ion channel protein [Gigaspora margarita]|uniref:Mechanosensitive ion channel protein n=1 Tax=Gigaspora margarita TaxID=4874 RepID=A0A8H4A674_GIGMA|nr:mechanosensitive ion channel protein [Gigaspora margarita]